MKCPQCAFENPEGLKFCGECGSQLERICSQCQAVNPPQFKFCGECGAALIPSQAKSPIDFQRPQSYTPNTWPIRS